MESVSDVYTLYLLGFGRLGFHLPTSMASGGFFCLRCVVSGGCVDGCCFICGGVTGFGAAAGGSFFIIFGDGSVSVYLMFFCEGGSLEHPCRWIACSGCWDPQRWWTILPVAGFMAGDGRFLLPLLLCQGDGRYSFSRIDTLGVPGVGSCGNTKAWSPLARWEADLARSWRLSPADGTKDDGGGALEDGSCVL